MFTALLQTNDKTNQDAFLDLITQPGGPVNIAREYLNNGILNPPEVHNLLEWLLFERKTLEDINLSLTEREGRTGEYWPEVVAVRTNSREVRTKTTGANIPQYKSSMNEGKIFHTGSVKKLVVKATIYEK